MTSSASQYDENTAAVYNDADGLALRRYAEQPTILDALGSIEGATVLDLACGTGILTRLLVAQGAHKSVGIDSSTFMIEQAKAIGDPSGRATYLVADVETMPQLGEFDAITAGFLFCYASTYG